MKKLSKEEFIFKANSKHNHKYDYSKVEYINSQVKVCIICPEHGEFWQTPANHLYGKKCPKCSTIAQHLSQTNSKEKFIEKAKQVHGDKYDYSKIEYKNNKTKVCIICPEHGEFWQKPNSHLNGRGCPLCGKTQKLTTEKFIEKAKQIHGNEYDYSKVEYVNCDTKVCIICPEHGEFWQTPHNHLNMQGCPQCNNCKNSILSQKIKNVLNLNNIDYIQEQTFEWLIDKSHLYIDYFLPKYNIGIECHGIQHFKSVEYFGGEEEFYNQQKRDLLKYALCKEHGIKIFYFADTEYKYFDKIYCDEKLMIEDIWNQHQK